MVEQSAIVIDDDGPGIPEDQQVDDTTVNMEYAKEWVQKIFETPRGDHTQHKSDAFKWLQENFGRGNAENAPPAAVA